jgi:hypothetical protein
MTMHRCIGRLLRPIRAGERRLLTRAVPISSLPESVLIESPAFLNGEAIPLRYTGLGEEICPPLRWSNIPPDAQELLLVVEDADAPLPARITHLIVHGIPLQQGNLEEGSVPNSKGRRLALQQQRWRLGQNSFGSEAWLGPHPLRGHGTHRYYFQLFALDTNLIFSKPPNRRQALQAMSGHVLAFGVLVGKCENNG